MIHEANVIYPRENDGIYLARRKFDIHAGGKSTKEGKRTFNGYGGKLDGKTPRAAAVREIKDEAGIIAKEEDFIPVADITFVWLGEDFSMRVYFYFLDKWEGKFTDTREMESPQFFRFAEPSQVPYSEMMPNDKYFLPCLLTGEKLVGEILIGPKDADGKREIKPNLRNDPEALKSI